MRQQETTAKQEHYERKTKTNIDTSDLLIESRLSGSLQAQLRSETNTAVVSAGTVAAPVFELKVDSRVAPSLEVCWSG